MQKLFILLFVILNSGLIAQSNENSLEEKTIGLKNNRDIKVTEPEQGILKLEFRNNKTVFKNTNEYECRTRVKYSPNFDSTIINLWTIDTLPYYHKYNYWQTVPLHNWQFDYLRLGDVNNNGKSELYGCKKQGSGDFEPVNIYELDNFNNYEFKFLYDSLFLVRSIYDIDRNDQMDVCLTASYLLFAYDQRIFSQPSDSSLATELNFSFNFIDQLNYLTLGNTDNDYFTDLTFAGLSTAAVYIYEYNPFVNNFDSVYCFKMPDEYVYGGFSIGDFDLDGNTDIVCATMEGNVYVIENRGDNTYVNSWQGMVETYNAYIHTWTHDVDKNGKPEFWVLGDSYFNGVPKTRITLFETDGDNSYKAVGKIDLIGVFSFGAGNMQTVDIDNDGTDEVAVCIDGNFLILKFNGKENYQSYEVYYIKQPGEGEGYMGGITADLLNNGKKDILISMGVNQTVALTRILMPDSTTAILKEQERENTFNLYQNYPNPFNPATNIRFEINKSEKVTIRVYNILGKEITIITNKTYTPGSYSIAWEAKDSNGQLLPSGVYLINISTAEYTKTIKALLLK